MKARILILLFVVGVLSACKTDIDINAPEKETMVIFGLLDPLADIQFIKINKTFVGSQDVSALVMAKDSSAYNYVPDDLDAYIDRYFQGKFKETYRLHDTILPKVSGIFSTGNNIIYYFIPPVKLNWTDELRKSSYHLIVKNKKTGLTATSETILLHSNSSIDTTAMKFQALATPIAFYTSQGSEGKVKIKVNQTVGGRLYQPIVRFYYTEFNSATDSVQKYADWTLTSKTVGGDVLNFGSASVEFTEIKGSEFYQFVAAQIRPNGSLLKRKADYLEFKMSAAEDEFATYLEVAKPSSGLNVDKPVYTNIICINKDGKSENGIGIFSSRTTVTEKRLMNSFSLDTLKSGYKTKNLSFK